MRIATTMLQTVLLSGMEQAQQGLMKSQAQLASGKKVQDLAGLGISAVADLSAHSMLSRQQSYVAAATGTTTTLSLYDMNISSLDTMGSDLRQSIQTAIGTGSTAGLQSAIESAFQDFRSTLNAQEGGVPLFGGGQSDANPFTPQALGDIVGMDPNAAFANGDVRASVRLSDGMDVQFGVTASELGSSMLSAFQTLASVGTIGSTPTAEQTQALKTAASQLDTAIGAVRAINARNGRAQNQVETLSTRAQDRANLLQGVISDKEDADMGQVANDIARQQASLQASYSVFSRLSQLNLTNYLR